MRGHKGHVPQKLREGAVVRSKWQVRPEPEDGLVGKVWLRQEVRGRSQKRPKPRQRQGESAVLS